MKVLMKLVNRGQFFEKKVSAIKALRHLSGFGLGLKEAKDIIDSLDNGATVQATFSSEAVDEYNERHGFNVSFDARFAELKSYGISIQGDIPSTVSENLQAACIASIEGGNLELAASILELMIKNK